MTEINVSPKTPINQFKLHVGLNDGHKLAEDLQGLQLGVQHTDRQTDRQLCATKQAPNVQTASGIYGPSYFFFSASPQRNTKDKIHTAKVTV